MGLSDIYRLLLLSSRMSAARMFLISRSMNLFAVKTRAIGKFLVENCVEIRDGNTKLFVQSG